MLIKQIYIYNKWEYNILYNHIFNIYNTIFSIILSTSLLIVHSSIIYSIIGHYIGKLNNWHTVTYFSFFSKHSN